MSLEIQVFVGIIAIVTIIKIIDFFEHQFEKKKRDKELKEKLALHAWKPVNIDAIKPVKPTSNLKHDAQKVKQVRK